MCAGNIITYLYVPCMFVYKLMYLQMYAYTEEDDNDECITTHTMACTLFAHLLFT